MAPEYSISFPDEKSELQSLRYLGYTYVWPSYALRCYKKCLAEEPDASTSAFLLSLSCVSPICFFIKSE